MGVTGVEVSPHVLVPQRSNERLLRTLGRSFRARGHDVTTANCAAQALAISETFDIGVFDYNLPDDTGDHIAAALHTRGLVRLVVFFTSHPVASDLDPTVLKPDVLGLVSVLESLLSDPST